MLFNIMYALKLLTVSCSRCGRDEMDCWCFHSYNWTQPFRIAGFAFIPIVFIMVTIIVAAFYEKQAN